MKANKLEKVEIKINNSVIEVKGGDIFQENGLNVEVLVIRALLNMNVIMLCVME
ncbi:hypothetical protein [uncultured Clostridium sp.]|uniref:hypothetical protein n=1 Tax=uncultured Clostridium sp. TaxID=59620 RepID=UPI002635166C|nr:hypothetical protein [uncultured Clostridium sp.]